MKLTNEDIQWAVNYFNKKGVYFPLFSPIISNREGLENCLVDLTSSDHSRLILNRFKAAYRERKNRQKPQSRQLSILINSDENKKIERLCRESNCSKKALVLKLIEEHEQLHKNISLHFEAKYKEKINHLERNIKALKENKNAARPSIKIKELNSIIKRLYTQLKGADKINTAILNLFEDEIYSLSLQITQLKNSKSEPVIDDEVIRQAQRIFSEKTSLMKSTILEIDTNTQSEVFMNENFYFNTPLQSNDEIWFAKRIGDEAPKTVQDALEKLMQGFENQQKRIEELERNNIELEALLDFTTQPDI
ncbi:hypothetical protein [Marinobacterium aestuarii]|nr:hypothetical protein [Marinobacterium aestuarii]